MIQQQQQTVRILSVFNNRVGGQTLSITGSGTVATAVAGSGKTVTLGTLR